MLTFKLEPKFNTKTTKKIIKQPTIGSLFTIMIFFPFFFFEGGKVSFTGREGGCISSCIYFFKRGKI